MKYDYGEEVLLETTNETGESVSTPCVVVAITEVDNEELSRAVNFPIGTILYTVEFEDGSDALVPESSLRSTDPSSTHI